MTTDQEEQSLREAIRSNGKILSMIAHELRSPLNSINGYLDLALSEVAGELNEQQREFMQRARAGSEHLFALLEDLLLIARADAGQVLLQREIIRIQDIITNVIEEVELSARDHGIIMSVDVPADVPLLYADAVRLQQVIRDLLSNALHFTPTGGRVVIATTIDGEQGMQEEEEDDDSEPRRTLCIRVSDSGPGIAPMYQERIFERFFRVPTESNHVGGQGLGLAIVKMIIELHGGSVHVESELGKGSTFCCKIPALLT